MKEAAGEANMTVVTIILIAIVLGVGTLIINGIMSSVQQQAEQVTDHGSSVVNNNTRP